MQLEYNEVEYIINHAAGPYLQEILKDLAGEIEWFVVSFDESLNEITQASEMDLCIRFWKRKMSG